MAYTFNTLAINGPFSNRVFFNLYLQWPTFLSLVAVQLNYASVILDSITSTDARISNTHSWHSWSVLWWFLLIPKPVLTIHLSIWSYSLWKKTYIEALCLIIQLSDILHPLLGVAGPRILTIKVFGYGQNSLSDI